MTWLSKQGDGATPMERTLAVLPDVEEAVREFYSLFWTEELVDAGILELVRFRVPMLHDVRADPIRYDASIDAGVTDEQIESIASWPTSPLFTPLQRQVLRVAEQFVIDPHGITDDDVLPIRDAVGSAGLVALMNAIGFVDHLCRIRVALDVEPDGGGRRTVPAPTADAVVY